VNFRWSFILRYNRVLLLQKRMFLAYTQEQSIHLLQRYILILRLIYPQLKDSIPLPTNECFSAKSLLWTTSQ